MAKMIEYIMSKLIPISEPQLSGNEKKYVLDCIEAGWISSLGSYIERFESEFAAYCGAKYGVSTSNGTVALHLALLALGIGKGDEVIVPTLTFVASANAVLYTGATPIFVDADEKTWTIDTKQILNKITSKTKAIIPVHLYGHPCDMEAINAIARAKHLFVIEDAAEAHGATFKDKKVGNLGTIGCFSFYGNKTITTGEGGMVVTNNKRLADKARFLKDHAMSKTKKYYHPILGYNYRMTNIQAAIGLAQLEQIQKFLDKKIKIAHMYNQLLGAAHGVVIPPKAGWATNSYWMYSVLIDKVKYGMSRDQLIQALKKHNIDSRPFFVPMHKLPMYRTDEVFPVAEKLALQGINLPSSTRLSDADVRKVAKVINDLHQ